MRPDGLEALDRGELLLVETGSRQPRTLANAFRDPVPLDRRGGTLDAAVKAMCQHLSRLDEAYGAVEQRRFLAVESGELPRAERGSLGDLAAWEGGGRRRERHRMTRHLALRLEAPLLSYGAEAIDNFGVVDDFPALSMLTGLLANALGWRRGHDTAKHQHLQDRLVFAARLDREGRRLTDYQTARLYSTSRGWTTRGRPEGHEWNPISWELDEAHLRGTGTKRYALTHQRHRDYDADSLCVVALRLERPGEVPTLDDLAQALNEPARPLFIGRKPCLPASPLFAGWSDGRDAHQALAHIPWQGVSHATARERRKEPPSRLRAQWPEGEGPYLRGRDEQRPVTDERNWQGGLHGGSRLVIRGLLQLEAVP